MTRSEQLTMTFTQAEWDALRGAICADWNNKKHMREAFQGNGTYSQEHIDFLESIMRKIDHAPGRT